MAATAIPRTAWLWWIGLLFSPGAAALMEIGRSFDQLVDRADQVFVGVVTDVRSAWGEGRQANNIYTFVTFSDLDVWKGEVSQAEYTLRIAGGQVGNAIQVFPGAPRFVVGKTYTVFVRDNQLALFPTVGISQGVYPVLWDQTMGRFVTAPLRDVEELLRDLPPGALPDFSTPRWQSLEVLKQRVLRRLRSPTLQETP